MSLEVFARLLCGALLLVLAACDGDGSSGGASEASTSTGSAAAGSECGGLTLPSIERQQAIDTACADWIASGMQTEQLHEPLASVCLDAFHAACASASSAESCGGLFAASQLTCSDFAVDCVWADVATVASAQTTCGPEQAAQRCVPMRVAGQGCPLSDGCGAPPPQGDEPTVHQLYWRSVDAGVDVIRINKASDPHQKYCGHVLGYGYCWSVGDAPADGPAGCDCAWDVLCQ